MMEIDGMDRLAIRLATSDDHPDLVRLATLDDGRLPLRPALVAEVDGEILVALSLRGGPPIADPFRPTAAIVELLELRRQQLRASPAPNGEGGLIAAIARVVGRGLRQSDA